MKETLLIAATLVGVVFGFFAADIWRWSWKWFRKLTHSDPDPRTLKYVVHIYSEGFTLVKASGEHTRERCDYYGQPYIEPPPSFKKETA